MGDGRARQRKITFSQWAKEPKTGIERFACKKEHEIDNFHSSILIREDNPDKEKILDAFYFTHDIYFR